jgi:hypothetical protein
MLLQQTDGVVRLDNDNAIGDCSICCISERILDDGNLKGGLDGGWMTRTILFCGLALTLLLNVLALVSCTAPSNGSINSNHNGVAIPDV